MTLAEIEAAFHRAYCLGTISRGELLMYLRNAREDRETRERMSNTPGARLARIKATHPLWRIERNPEFRSIGFVAFGPHCATCRSAFTDQCVAAGHVEQVIRVATVTDLEAQLAAADPKPGQSKGMT